MQKYYFFLTYASIWTKKYKLSDFCGKSQYFKDHSFISSSRYNKRKAGLQYCCSTHLGSGIAFVSEQTTPSPRCMYIYTQIRAYLNIYTIGILVSQCFGYQIYQIQMSQNIALKTLFLICTYFFTLLSPTLSHLSS